MGMRYLSLSVLRHAFGVRYAVYKPTLRIVHLPAVTSAGVTRNSEKLCSADLNGHFRFCSPVVFFISADSAVL